MYMSVSMSILIHQHQNRPTNKISCRGGTGPEWTSVLAPRMSPNSSHFLLFPLPNREDNSQHIDSCLLIYHHFSSNLSENQSHHQGKRVKHQAKKKKIVLQLRAKCYMTHAGHTKKATHKYKTIPEPWRV